MGDHFDVLDLLSPVKTVYFQIRSIFSTCGESTYIYIQYVGGFFMPLIERTAED